MPILNNFWQQPLFRFKVIKLDENTLPKLETFGIAIDGKNHRARLEYGDAVIKKIQTGIVRLIDTGEPIALHSLQTHTIFELKPPVNKIPDLGLLCKIVKVVQFLFISFHLIFYMFIFIT